jgi:hypothetical protein
MLRTTTDRMGWSEHEGSPRMTGIMRKIATVAVLTSSMMGVGVVAAQAHGIPPMKAECWESASQIYIRMQTPANVPFLYTGSTSTQRVWFRANVYRVIDAAGSTEWLGAGDWFYNDLGPNQLTTSYWHHNPDGAVVRGASTWMIRGREWPFLIKYELYWYQGGRQVDYHLVQPMVADLNTGLVNKYCYKGL